MKIPFFISMLSLFSISACSQNQQADLPVYIDYYGSESATKQTLAEPVENKIYFAGEALSVDNGSTVPGAAESAYAMIETMLAG